MAQIFHARANTIIRICLALLLIVPAGTVAAWMVVMRSDYVTGRNETVTQPVMFSHRHHTAEIGIDCRYCHTSVEDSAFAGIPPTETCMTCHSQLFTEADMLAPVRQSWVTGTRLNWNRVHDLPDYVYFNHSVHLAGGVACTTCHGAVGEMRLTRQVAPLTMEWCLSCHRAPGKNLSPRAMLYDPFPTEGKSAEEGHALLAEYGIDTSGLTDCSACHR